VRLFSISKFANSVFTQTLTLLFLFPLQNPTSSSSHHHHHHGTTLSLRPPSAMPQSRDRRVTPVDLAAAFARNRAFLIYNDPPPHRTPPRTFPRGRARAFLGSENTPPSSRRSRGRVPSRSLLPAWYPRTPLRDITAIARVSEN